MRGGTDENDAGLLAFGREDGILGKEPIAGVDGSGAVLLCGIEDAVDAQVAVGGRSGADALRLIRHADVRRIAVGVGIDRHGGDAHFPQRAHDAHGDLPPVGHQHLAEHQREL